MTNTIKTLDETRKEGWNELYEKLDDSSVYVDGKTWLDSFAEKVWNAALDACREKMPTLDEIAENFSDHRSGDWVRREALSAIDSLRTGSGKDVCSCIEPKDSRNGYCLICGKWKKDSLKDPQG